MTAVAIKAGLIVAIDKLLALNLEHWDTRSLGKPLLIWSISMKCCK